MRKTVLAATTALVVASGAIIGQASAADLDFAPAPAPAPFVPTWQGFYIGGHIGYGEADFDARGDAEFSDFESFESEFGVDLDDFGDFDPDTGVLNIFRAGLGGDGLLGGIQGGYNWQAGSMVFGIEGDISFTDWDDSSEVFVQSLDDFDVAADEVSGVVSTEVDFLASVRGRLGYAMDSVMIYGTGGLAWADASARGALWLDDEELGSVKEDFDDLGFVVGGGMAWMVVPQTMSVGIEGLYYFFDQKETLFDETFDYVDAAQEDETVRARATASLDDAWVIRARADFHF